MANLEMEEVLVSKADVNVNDDPRISKVTGGDNCWRSQTDTDAVL